MEIEDEEEENDDYDDNVDEDVMSHLVEPVGQRHDVGRLRLLVCARPSLIQQLFSLYAAVQRVRDQGQLCSTGSERARTMRER